jgi:hypothetical protein
MFRGNNGQPVFVRANFRRHFIDRLPDAVARHGCRLRALTTD